MSDEHLLKLRSIVKDSGTGVQGHSRSPVENARALLHVHSYQQQGLSYDSAIKATATAELASPSTLRTISQQFATTGAITPPRTPVTRSNPLHPFYCGESGPSFAAEQLIHRELHEVTLKNVFQSCTTLRHALEEQLGIVVSKSTVHRWLHALGYQYGKKHFVNQDRSYRNAMTKDGLLEVEGTEPSNILTELYHSCALIFDEVCVDGITPADYHDTINGEKFIGWMQQRLFPTVQKLYPGRKMYLVLDNAKYHHHRGPDWFSPSNKKKGQLADFLRQRSVQSITVDSERVIPASKFSADARGNAGGPTLAQLKTAVKAHLAAHPEINTTVPQQLMEDKRYELLYTPPYVSDLQPIEMIWAFTKALVARQSHRSRTAHACAVQTREAMEQVTAELCQKQISHCHAWIERFMQSEEGGSLQQFGTLQALKPLAAALQRCDDAAPPPTPIAEEDEEEEGEAGWTH